MAENNLPSLSSEDIAKKIRKQIQNQFASLIPDEQWDDFISDELEKMMKPRKDYPGGPVKPSVFSEMITAELEPMVKERMVKVLEKHLEKQDWEAMVHESLKHYGSGHEPIKAAMTILLSQAHATIMDQFAGNMAMNMSSAFSRFFQH